MCRKVPVRMSARAVSLAVNRRTFIQYPQIVVSTSTARVTADDQRHPAQVRPARRRAARGRCPAARRPGRAPCRSCRPGPSATVPAQPAAQLRGQRQTRGAGCPGRRRGGRRRRSAVMPLTCVVAVTARRSPARVASRSAWRAAGATHPALLEVHDLVGQRDRRAPIGDDQDGTAGWRATSRGWPPPPGGRPRSSRRPAPADRAGRRAPGPGSAVGAARRRAWRPARRRGYRGCPAGPRRTRRPGPAAARTRPRGRRCRPGPGSRCPARCRRRRTAPAVPARPPGRARPRSARAGRRPSSATVPEAGSTSRTASDAIVDLPEPVGPTRATVRPAGTSKDTSCRTSGPSSYP